MPGKIFEYMGITWRVKSVHGPIGHRWMVVENMANKNDVRRLSTKVLQ